MKILSKFKKLFFLLPKAPKLVFVFLLLFSSINILPFLFESNSKKVEAQVPAGPGQWGYENGTLSNENRNTAVTVPVTTAGEAWRRTAGRFFYAPFIASDGTVYDTDGATLYALNKNDGSVLWTKALNGADNPYNAACKANIIAGGSTSGYRIVGIASNGDINIAGLDNQQVGNVGGYVFMRIRPTGANNPPVLSSYKDDASCAIGSGGSFFYYKVMGMSADGNYVYIQQYLKGAIVVIYMTPGSFQSKMPYDRYLCQPLGNYAYNDGDSTGEVATDNLGSIYFSYGATYFKSSFANDCVGPQNVVNPNLISWYTRQFTSDASDHNTSVMISYEPTLGREVTLYSGGTCGQCTGMVLGTVTPGIPYRYDNIFNGYALTAADRTRNLLFGAAVGNPGQIGRYDMKTNRACPVLPNPPHGNVTLPGVCYAVAGTGIWGSFTGMALGANMMYVTSLNAAKTGLRLEARDVNNFTVNTFTMDFPANNFGQTAIANDGSVYISTGSILVKLGPASYGSVPRATVKLSGNAPGGNRTVFAGDQNTFIANLTDADNNLGTSFTGDPAGVKRAGMIWVGTPNPFTQATSVFTESNVSGDYVTYNSLPFASTTAYTGSYSGLGPYTATNCSVAPNTLGNCTFNVSLTFNNPGVFVVGVSAYDSSGVYPNTNKCSGNYPYASFGTTAGPPWAWVRCDAAGTNGSRVVTDKDYIVVTVIPKGSLSTSGSLTHSVSRFQGTVSNNSNNRPFAQTPIMYESFNGLSGAQTSITDDYNAGYVGTASGSVVASTTAGNAITGSAIRFSPSLNSASNLSYAVPPYFGPSYTGSFTYSFWAKPMAAVTNGGVIDATGTYLLDRSSATTPLVDVKVTNGKYTFQYRYDDGTGLTDLTSAGAQAAVQAPNTTWAYVVIQRNMAMNQFRLYVNGVLAATAADNTVNSYNNTAKPLTPGAPKIAGHNVNCAGAVITGCFNGYIDDFKIYNNALSDTQIAYEYSRLNPAANAASTSSTVRYFNDSNVSTGSTANISLVKPLFNTNDSNGVYGITSYGNMVQKYADSNVNLPVISNTTLSQLGPQFIQNVNMSLAPSWLTGSPVAGYQISSLAAVPDNLGSGTKSGIIYVIDLSAASNKSLTINYDLDNTALKTKKGLMIYVTGATLVTMNTPAGSTMSSSSTFMLLSNTDIYVQNAQGINNFNAGLVSDGNIIYNCATYSLATDTTGCVANQNGFSFAKQKVELGPSPAQYKNTPDVGGNKDSLYYPTLNITYSANYIPDFRKLFSYTNYYSSTVGFDY